MGLYRGVTTVYSFVCDLSSFPKQNHVTLNNCHRKGKVKEHHPTQDPTLFGIDLGNTEYILQYPERCRTVFPGWYVDDVFPITSRLPTSSNCSIFLAGAIYSCLYVVFWFFHDQIWDLDWWGRRYWILRRGARRGFRSFKEDRGCTGHA